MQHRKITERPEVLHGASYKIKNPGSDYSIYITINDLETDGGKRPFEIFINSRNPEHHQWVTSITRMLSALFREGGNIDFIIQEMKEVIDPRGGYYQKGKYIASDIAAIGNVIEKHIQNST